MHLKPLQKPINEDKAIHLVAGQLEVFGTVGNPLPTSSEDPALPLTDVQLVLGHALLTTTQLYLTPRKEDVIRRVLAHHGEQVRQARQRARPAPAPGYRRESLDVLFGHVPS